MAVPLNLLDIQSGFLSVVGYNTNNTLLEEALGKALNRVSNADNNSMEVDLDLGLNKIFNLKDATGEYEAVNYKQLQLLSKASPEGFAYVGTGVDGVVEDYAAGIEITSYSQIVRDVLGEFWRASSSTTLPYTTTGTGLPEGGAFVSVGDAVLRQELATTTVGQGSDLVAHVGTADTVTEALGKRVVYVGSVAELEALSLPVGTAVFLTEDGRAGEFVVKTGTPPSDPQQGVYVVLANGGYAERVYLGAIDVKWFGAKGDNVSDDTLPIQSAIDFGSEIKINEFYRVGALTLKSDLSITGNGTDTSGFLNIGTSTCLTAVGTEISPLKNIIIENLLFQRETDLGNFYDFVLTENLKSLKNRFVGILSATTSSYCTYRGCKDTVQRDELYENNASCILGSSIGYTVAGVYGENHMIENIVIKDAGQGLSIRYQNNIVLRNSVASGSTTQFGCGFLIEAECSNVIVDGCTSYGHVRSGFYVEGNVALGIKGLKVVNCVGYDNGEAGLVFNANFENCQVVNGHYYGNNGTFNGAGYGIMGAGSFDVSITGAIIRDNINDGIWWNNAFRVNITGCKIQDNNGWGINLAGSASTVLIDANHILGNPSGDVLGVPGSSYYNFGRWIEYTPLFYKSNNSTVASPTLVFARRKVTEKTVFVQGHAEFSSGTLDSGTFISLPFIGDWATGSGADSKALIGVAFEQNNSALKINGVFSNVRGRISGTETATVTLDFKIEYPIA